MSTAKSQAQRLRLSLRAVLDDVPVEKALVVSDAIVASALAVLKVDLAALQAHAWVDLNTCTAADFAAPKDSHGVTQITVLCGAYLPAVQGKLLSILAWASAGGWQSLVNVSICSVYSAEEHERRFGEELDSIRHALQSHAHACNLRLAPLRTLRLPCVMDALLFGGTFFTHTAGASTAAPTSSSASSSSPLSFSDAKSSSSTSFFKQSVIDESVHTLHGVLGLLNEGSSYSSPPPTLYSCGPLSTRVAQGLEERIEAGVESGEHASTDREAASRPTTVVVVDRLVDMGSVLDKASFSSSNNALDVILTLMSHSAATPDIPSLFAAIPAVRSQLPPEHNDSHSRTHQLICDVYSACNSARLFQSIQSKEAAKAMEALLMLGSPVKAVGSVGKLLLIVCKRYKLSLPASIKPNSPAPVMIEACLGALATRFASLVDYWDLYVLGVLSLGALYCTLAQSKGDSKASSSLREGAVGNPYLADNVLWKKLVSAQKLIKVTAALAEAGGGASDNNQLNLGLIAALLDLLKFPASQAPKPTRYAKQKTVEPAKTAAVSIDMALAFYLQTVSVIGPHALSRADEARLLDALILSSARDPSVLRSALARVKACGLQAYAFQRERANARTSGSNEGKEESKNSPFLVGLMKYVMKRSAEPGSAPESVFENALLSHGSSASAMSISKITESARSFMSFTSAFSAIKDVATSVSSSNSGGIRVSGCVVIFVVGGVTSHEIQQLRTLLKGRASASGQKVDLLLGATGRATERSVLDYCALFQEDATFAETE